MGFQVIPKKQKYINFFFFANYQNPSAQGCFAVYTNGQLVGQTKVITLKNGWNKEKFTKPITLKKNETYMLCSIFSATVYVSHNNVTNTGYYCSYTGWISGAMPSSVSWIQSSYHQYCYYVK